LHLFLLGLTTGLVYFAGTLYWTGTVMQVYGGVGGFVAAGVGLLLDAYLALYPALFAVIVGRLAARLGSRAVLLAPAVWVATELGRGYLLTGFPWVLLGYSQVHVLPIAQLASLLGVFGVSGLVALASAAIAYTVLTPSYRARAAVVGVTLLLVAGTGAWGAWRLQQNTLAGPDPHGVALKIALVQGNIPQDEKWDRAHATAILQRYLAMTREAAEKGATFIVWPEASTPFFFEEDPVGNAAIRRVARETGRYVLVGSDQMERSTPPKYYNAAFLIRPDGTTGAVYRKMHLVPFGEYVPLKRLLFFASPLVEAVSDFSPGDEAAMLPLGPLKVSTAICYEVVYPNLIRRFVLGGAQLLTTITNDAWYGSSSAPYQHFDQAAMRAIEQGRYLARSANTGISGIVDPYGRVLQRSALFEQVVLVGDVRLLSGLTFYARFGDAFAFACVALTLISLIVALTARETDTIAVRPAWRS
jgi:apolipoprotein N-acyltransferase